MACPIETAASDRQPEIRPMQCVTTSAQNNAFHAAGKKAVSTSCRRGQRDFAHSPESQVCEHDNYSVMQWKCP